MSFSKAAKVLGVTQPSLSAQIKNLEEQLGFQLFLRNGKSISLTSKGEELLRTAGLYSDLREEVNRISDHQRNREEAPATRVLVTDEIERPFVAEVVAKISNKLRGRIEIFSSTKSEVLKEASHGGPNILLSHEKVNSSWNHVKIEFPVFLVTSERMPRIPTFDNPGNIEKVLKYYDEDLIVPAVTMKLGKEFAAFKRKHKIKKTVKLESNIISCLVRFVASGSGCSFLPLPYIKSSLYENHLRMIGPRDGFWKHSIFIYADLSQVELDNHPIVKTIRNYGTM